MNFELPSLPYDLSALEPHISRQTLEFHHGKHHRAYVTNLNTLTQNTPFAGKSLESIVKETANDKASVGIFNNAAQVWNHTFFWHSMKPAGGGKPAGQLAERLDRDFGSLDKFKEAFLQEAAGQFGSGWVWLVADKSRVSVVKTGNAGTPIMQGQTPLLTCDVWEHAYYLDYQNRRPDFVRTFLDQLANWDFAAKNLASVS